MHAIPSSCLYLIASRGIYSLEPNTNTNGLQPEKQLTINTALYCCFFANHSLMAIIETGNKMLGIWMRFEKCYFTIGHCIRSLFVILYSETG